MRWLNSTTVRWALGVAIAATLGGALIGVSHLSPPALTPVAAARDRWSASAVAHYRMVVEVGSPCRLEVEVRDERVAAVLHEDPCGYPARTVTDLFRMIERAPSPLYSCAPPSCACRNVVTIFARYDEQLGYPGRIAVQAEREANWRDLSFWRYVWSERRLPDCVWSSSADIVNVRSMLPLP